MPHVALMVLTAAKNRNYPEVVSMGCRLNGYESEKMAVLAREAGLRDAVIINSCAVTNEAVRQTRQKIRQLKKANPARDIIVTGCASQIDPGQFKQMPEVTSVIGNAEKMSRDAWRVLQNRTDTNLVGDIMTAETRPVDLPLHTPQGRTRAYVQIQNGCDHRCTFCIIPFGRGNSRSVPVEQVTKEIRSLVDGGCNEVVLTGVDITSYGPDLPDQPTLGGLVSHILSTIPELPRLRLSSIDGAEIDDLLFDMIIGEERLAPYLHLSLQSGDDMILKRMKRRHSRAQAIDFCRRIKERRPDVAFGADIIAGFPTETEEMFHNSVSLVSDCDLTFLHVFPYSARSGTPAARMPQHDKRVIQDRAARLRAAGDAALAQHLGQQVGSVHVALTEQPSTNEAANGRGRARLANFTEVQFRTSDPSLLAPGQFVRITATGHDDRRLTGFTI